MRGESSQTWAKMNAQRIGGFGLNAVAAPEFIGLEKE
jgi:hypothetical protein